MDTPTGSAAAREQQLGGLDILIDGDFDDGALPTPEQRAAVKQWYIDLIRGGKHTPKPPTLNARPVGGFDL